VLFVCGLAQNDDCDKPQIDPTDGSQYGFCAEKKPFILTRTHALTHQQAIADALRLEQVKTENHLPPNRDVPLWVRCAGYQKWCPSATHPMKHAL